MVITSLYWVLKAKMRATDLGYCPDCITAQAHATNTAMYAAMYATMDAPAFETPKKTASVQ